MPYAGTFALPGEQLADLVSIMAFYIFTQGERTDSGWELLETIKRPDLAKEVYGNYCQLLSAQAAVKLEMVEAATAKKAKSEL